MSETTLSTYHDRHLQYGTIKDLDNGILFEGGWGFGGTDEQKALLSLYESYFVEQTRGNTITGMATVQRVADGMLVDRWLWRKSDQELAAEHQEFVRKNEERKQAMLEANRVGWAGRTDLLPDVLRERLERFHVNGGEYFEANGWGYELTCCELAVLFIASDGEEDDATNAYAEDHGISGNQHGFARMLARLVSEGQDISEVPSALTPLTGDPFYLKGDDA